MVRDSVLFMAKLSWEMTLIFSVIMFAFLFLFVPLLVLWMAPAEQSPADIKRAVDLAMFQVLVIRLASPARWAGIAILVGGLFLAMLKYLQARELTRGELGWVSRLARMFAKMID
jgi:hypothetical protein